MAESDTFVSLLAVCRDRAAVLPAFVSEACALLDARYANYELILLDNGSEDGTPAVVRSMLAEHKCVRYLRLARRLTDETALTAGLDTAIGDVVVTLHPDFDPVGEVPAVVDACSRAHDVVLGRDRSPPPQGPLYRMCRWAFGALARRVVAFEPRGGLASLRGLSRSAVNAVTRVRSHRRNLSVVLAEVGLEPVFHPYDRISRSGDVPRPRIGRAVRTGLSLLLHHSATPLRIVSLLGLTGSSLSLLYSAYVIAVYLSKRDVMPGWTTLSLQVSAMSVVAFAMLALIGESVGRVLDELVDRPLYHVREERVSAVVLSDATRRNVTDAAAAVPGAATRGAA